MEEPMDKVIKVVSDTFFGNTTSFASFVVGVLGLWITYETYKYTVGKETLFQRAISTARDYFSSSDRASYKDILKAYTEYEKSLSNFVMAIKSIRNYAYYNELPPPPSMLVGEVKKMREKLTPLQVSSDNAFRIFHEKLDSGALYLSDKKIQEIRESSLVLGRIRAQANGIWMLPDDGISDQDKKNHDLLVEMFDEYRKTRRKVLKVF